MEQLVYSDYFDNDREAAAGSSLQNLSVQEFRCSECKAIVVEVPYYSYTNLDPTDFDSTTTSYLCNNCGLAIDAMAVGEDDVL